MTDASSCLAVQNGQGPFGSNVADSQSYLHDGRGVSASPCDLLFQATSWDCFGYQECQL